MTKTFTLRGRKVRTQSSCRYVVVVIYRGENARDPMIWKRSNSQATANKVRTDYNARQRRYGDAYVVDTATGVEV